MTDPTGLLLFTDGNVNNSGTPGVQSWTAGTVLDVSDPNFALEPGVTSGQFSKLFDLANFTDKDTKVDALHYVRNVVTVGQGTATFTLRPGDLLLSLDKNSATLTSLNSLRVNRDDVFVFRPATAGNYAVGTFFPLLKDMQHVIGGNDVKGIALVERPTVLGDRTLSAGSFLVIRQGADDDVQLFTPTGVGTGATAGAVATLIAGKDLGITSKLNGVDLVESATTLGGRSLTAGTLLLAMDDDKDGIGTNALAVSKFDIVALNVTQTTLGSGQAAAAASLLFEGSDVGLHSGPETIRGFSLSTLAAPPTAEDDAYATNEDTPLFVGPSGVLANDTTPTGSTLVASLSSGPAHGTVSLSATGAFTYTPAANYFGPDSFTYTATSSDGTATATVNLTVNPVNARPTFSIAANPPAVNEDGGPQTVTAFVTDASAGPNETGQALTFRVVGNTNPALFAAGPAIAADGTLTYTPAANANGFATIIVVLQDDGGTANGGQDTSFPRTFTVIVRPVNDPPLLDPVADRTVAEDAGPQVVPLTGILAGGGETQALRVTAASSNPALIPNPTVAYVSPTSTGALTFASNPNANGTATITVTVRDAGANNFLGDGDDAVTTRSFVVTVTPVEDPPVANPDTYSTASGLALQILGAGVLANDTDPDGDPLTAAIVTGPANGLLVLLPTGGFTYTPALGFTGVDTFTYQAADPSGAVSTATVTLNVGLGNRPPVVAAVAYSTPENTTLSGNVLSGSRDPDGDALAAALTAGPTNGRLTFNVNGAFVYAPNANYSGPDSFTYSVSDGHGGAASGVATITVTSVNNPPTATDDAATTDEDTAVTVDVRANDADPEGDPLTVVAVTQGANGAVTTDGLAVRYTPDPDFNGADSFTYTIADGNGGFATATVNVTVTPVNDPPTLDPIADRTIPENDGLQFVRLTGITAGGGESQPVTVTAVSDNPQLIGNPAVFHLTSGATGLLIFAPKRDASGTATITVTANDGVTTFSRSFVVTVTPVNQPPTITAVADQTVREGETIGPLPFTVGDAETAADDLIVTATSRNAGLIPDANITITTVGGRRQITLVPTADASGASVITLTVSDGAASRSTSFVVRVTSVNHVPTAAGDTFQTSRGSTLTIPASGVLANDDDPDGDPLTAAVVTPTLHGTLRLNPDGSFAYDPEAGFQGVDTFTYRAVDSSGLASALATVTIRVLPAAAPTATGDAYAVTDGFLRVRPADGVLANDLSATGDKLRAVLATRPAHGTLFFGRNGGFLYVAEPGFAGTDTFAYQAVDPFGAASGAVTVTLQVRGAAVDHFTVVQDHTLVATGPVGLAEHDGSADVVVDVTAQPGHGDVVMSEDGAFTYQPAAGFVGEDTFRYSLSDGSGETIRTVRITVEAAAVAPVAPVVPPAPPTVVPTVPPPAVTAATALLAPAIRSTAASVVLSPPTDGAPAPAVAAPVNGDRGAVQTTRDVPPTYVIALTTVAPTAVPGVVAKPAPDRNAALADAKPTPADVPAAAPNEAKPAAPVAVASPMPVPAPVVVPPTVPPMAPDTGAVVDVVAPSLNQSANELRADTDDRAAADAVVTTAVAATAGFVLLNTRAVFWLVSALLVRPAVWRRFDPIDVIYAWENDQPRDPNADPAGGGESLQSIVG